MVKDPEVQMTHSWDPTELTISIKTQDATFKKKFLLYDGYNLDSRDPIVCQCINECLAELKGDYADDEIKIKVRANLLI